MSGESHNALKGHLSQQTLQPNMNCGPEQVQALMKCRLEKLTLFSHSRGIAEPAGEGEQPWTDVLLGSLL